MKKIMMVAAAAFLATSVFPTDEAMAGVAAQNRCKVCHTFDKGGDAKVGPNLFGIIGRKAGSVDGFKYGSYLKDADFTWDEERIRAWINDSQGVAKAAGKRAQMPSQHIKGKKADEVIAFLETLK